MEAIFFNPIFKEKIWGGSKLTSAFDFDLPTDKTGEAWLISAHTNGVSTINSPEKLKGIGLDQLFQDYPEYFGPYQEENFPLLIKILDANQDLSVQVHPNDDYAKKNIGLTEFGKTECWYVLAAEEDAEIILGHRAQTAEEFLQLVETKQWDKLLRRIPVKAGDFIDVPAGTIHAIGSGIMILEIQQSSDTTYRVYDYGRKDKDGRCRDLHLTQAIEVTQFPHRDSPSTRLNFEYRSSNITPLLRGEYFSVYHYQLNSKLEVELGDIYYLMTVIDGEGKIHLDNKSYSLKKGVTFLLPYGEKKIILEGKLKLIVSHPALI